MANPYNQQKQEALYHSYEAGFTAITENECPYEEDDQEARDLYHAWSRGFKSNKARPQPKVIVKEMAVSNPEAYNLIDTPTVIVAAAKTTPVLADIPTEVLLQEVAKRLKAFEEAKKKYQQIFGV